MKTLLLLLSAAFLVLATPVWASVTPGQAGSMAKPDFVPGQVLLKAAPGTSLPEVARAIDATILRSVGDGSIVLLDVGAGRVADSVETLGKRKGVLFAEPNWLRQPHVPDDSGFIYKWDLHNDGTLADGSDQASADADVDWLEAYNLLGAGFTGSATIAVIDTGIDASHHDLDGKISAGYDYLDGDGDPSDDYGHGTHVAGIALAETTNGYGTAGLAFGDLISVMPLRVCDSGGCPTSAIVNAIYHASNQGADVINLSLGGRFGSSAEEQAINAAWNNGLVIVASSGNDGSGKVSFPAAFTNAIAVGSTNWHDALATYSNTGSALDIVAPGGDMNRYHDPGGIYSTMPTYDVYLTTTYSYSKTFDQLQGTSMAAPQVAGLAGLLFAVNPALTNVEVRNIIETTADDLGKSGWDRNFGHGRINIHNAILAATGAGVDTPPSVALTAPADGATVGGTISLIATATDDNGVIEVAFTVDGSLLATDTDGSDGWSADWETTTASEGGHTLTATAIDTIGQDATDSVNVIVDNVADAEVTVLALSVSTITAGTTVDTTISGSGFVDGVIVTLENGSGPAPTIDNTTYIDSGTLTVTISAKAGGPPRDRLWDVRVTNTDGSSGVLIGGLTVQP